MTARRRGRRWAGLAVVVLAGAVPLLPGPAWADGDVSAPAEPVVAHGKVALSGTVDFSERDPLELRLTAPGKPAQVVASAGPAEIGQRTRTLSFEFITAPCNVPQACATGTDAPNGGWSLELVHQRPPQFGGPEVLARQLFVVDVPARPPSQVDATLTARREITVSWARGTEPDLLRWEVSDDGDQSRRIAVADAGCDGGTGICSAVFDYPERATGTRSFSVAAVRACGAADCQPVASSRVTTEPVTLPPMPSPSASPSPSSSPSPGSDGSDGSGGPDGSGGSDGSGTGGSDAAGSPAAAAARAQRAAVAFAEGFSSFEPKLGLPKLPPLPQASTPSVQAPSLPDGAFEELLGYEDQVVREPVAAQSGRTSVLTSSGGLLDDEQLMRSLAGALVLLLGGAHLRTWLVRSRDEIEF